MPLSASLVTEREAARDRTSGQFGEHERSLPETQLLTGASLTEDEVRERADALLSDLRAGFAELGVSEGELDDAVSRMSALTAQAVDVNRTAAGVNALEEPKQNDVWDMMSGFFAQSSLDENFRDIDLFDTARAAILRGQSNKFAEAIRPDMTPAARRLVNAWSLIPDDGTAAGREAGPMWGMTRESFDEQFQEVFAHLDARDVAERDAQ